MNNNLQPKDYAAIAFAAAELHREISACANFQKIMKYGELPGYKGNVLLKITICSQEEGSLELASINVLPDGASGTPAEPEDEDDE